MASFTPWGIGSASSPLSGSDPPRPASRRAISPAKSGLPTVSSWIRSISSSGARVPSVSSSSRAVSGRLNPFREIRLTTPLRVSSGSVSASGCPGPISVSR